MRQVFFEATDGLELAGLLYVPEKQTKKIVIAVHGMASNCMKKRDATIAKQLTGQGIAYLAFNNRGHDLISYSRKPIEGNKKTVFIGTSYEDVLESYADIKGAIQEALRLGYTDIYLQGHSLGCTKIVYTYRQFLENKEEQLIHSIKAVLLLSLIDIVGTQNYVLKGKYDEMLEEASQKESKGKELEFMANKAFIWPISAKTYLRYFRDNTEIDIAKYGQEEYEYPELNAMQVPIFMRWGKEKDLILQQPEKLVSQMQEKLTGEIKDIGVIEKTGHNYRGQEIELAQQIGEFLKLIEEEKPVYFSSSINFRENVTFCVFLSYDTL